MPPRAEHLRRTQASAHPFDWLDRTFVQPGALGSLAPVVERQTISGLDPTRRRLTSGELEDLPRALAPPKPPRTDVRRDTHDPQLAVEEDDVDREPHEPRVNGRARADQQPFVARKIAPAQEPAKARKEAVGNDAAVAGDASVRAEKPVRRGSHVRSIRVRSSARAARRVQRVNPSV
jgi:hypothetical protein